MLGSHSEGEIEWSLEVSGGRELGNGRRGGQESEWKSVADKDGRCGVVSDMWQRPGLAEAPGSLWR